MTRHEVLLTADAEADIEEIVEYLAQHDSPAAAERLLSRIGEAIDGLKSHSEHGSYPKELLALGIREFRQVFFKPYRLIYRVEDRNVCLSTLSSMAAETCRRCSPAGCCDRARGSDQGGGK